MSDLVMTYCDGISPLGVDMDQSCASVMAGLSRFQDHASVLEIPDSGVEFSAEPLVISPIAWFASDQAGPARVARITLDLITAWATAHQRRGKVGVFWAFPLLDDVTRKWGLDESFLQGLWQSTGIPAAVTVEVVNLGRPGMLVQLHRARQWLREVPDGMALVGGSETYLDEARLCWLDQQMRLRTSRNLDGFIAGEAGSLCAFERQNPKRQRLLQINDIGMGAEPNAFSGEKQSSATGLCEAVGQVWDEALAQSCSCVYAGLNGESYGFQEWALAMLRTIGSSDIPVEHPADCLGDLGAASGGFQLALAQRQLAERGGACLIWSAGDGPERVALTAELSILE